MTFLSNTRMLKKVPTMKYTVKKIPGSRNSKCRSLETEGILECLRDRRKMRVAGEQ